PRVRPPCRGPSARANHRAPWCRCERHGSVPTTQPPVRPTSPGWFPARGPAGPVVRVRFPPHGDAVPRSSTEPLLAVLSQYAVDPAGRRGDGVPEPLTVVTEVGQQQTEIVFDGAVIPCQSTNQHVRA